MQKFCKKCGRRLDEKTGLCPNCDKSVSKREIRVAKKEYKKITKKEKKANRSLGQRIRNVCLRILIILLIFLLLAGGATCTLVYFDVVKLQVVEDILDFWGISRPESETFSDNTSDTSTLSDEENSKELEELNREIEEALDELENVPIDADSYFRNNSTVISEIEINNSNNVHSEIEAYNNLNERGFTESPIETEYSMNGEYCGLTAISNTSQTKHPIYQTTYIAENGDVWTIIEINGVVMANPVSYNYQSGTNVQLIISETETIISYDSRTNKFYETIPNDSELIVKTISRIDAETLEKLTFGAIDEL